MTQPFTEDQLHDLLELETVILDLVESPGWEALKEAVRATMDADERRLLSGGMQDIREYDKVCHRRLGAQAVFDYAEKVVPGTAKEYRRQHSERQG